MMTTFERGRAVGRQEGGIEALRESALRQLEFRFGTLSPEAKTRLAGLSLDDRRERALSLMKANSLKDLNLEE